MIKILKGVAPPKPKSTKGKGERVERLDPLTREMMEVFVSVKEGDAFDVSGTMRKIVTCGGFAEARSARENNRPRRKLKMVDLGNGKIRVFIVAQK